MNLEQINFNLNAYKKHEQIIDAVHFLLHQFDLGSDNLAGFEYRAEPAKELIVLTTEGEVGEKQKVLIPSNIFNFDFFLIINMIAHEMLHVQQKSPENLIEDKNEREFQAYYEMLFHKVFTKVPDVSDYYKKIFADKAFVYYKRMGENSELQKKYALQKLEIEALLEKIS